MKLKVPIEDVRESDIVCGKRVVKVRRWDHARYVQLSLGVLTTVSGHFGQMVEVERP